MSIVTALGLTEDALIGDLLPYRKYERVVV
jgi:hypothetical protein